jgi:hypothetical protein
MTVAEALAGWFLIAYMATLGILAALLTMIFLVAGLLLLGSLIGQVIAQLATALRRPRWTGFDPGRPGGDRTAIWRHKPDPLRDVVGDVIEMDESPRFFGDRRH